MNKDNCETKGYLEEKLPIVIGDYIADVAYTPKEFIEMFDEFDSLLTDKESRLELHTIHPLKKPDISIDNLLKVLEDNDYCDWDVGTELIDASKLDRLNQVFHDMIEDLNGTDYEPIDYEDSDIEEIREKAKKLKEEKDE